MQLGKTSHLAGIWVGESAPGARQRPPRVLWHKWRHFDPLRTTWRTLGHIFERRKLRQWKRTAWRKPGAPGQMPPCPHFL